MPWGPPCAVVQLAFDSSRHGTDPWEIVFPGAMGDAGLPMGYSVETALLLPLRRPYSADYRYETKEEV